MSSTTEGSDGCTQKSRDAPPHGQRNNFEFPVRFSAPAVLLHKLVVGCNSESDQADTCLMKSIGQNWRGTWPTTSCFSRRNTLLLVGFLLACVLGYKPLASRSARDAVVTHQPTQGTGTGPTPLLQIQSVVHHGRVVEVRGRTAPKTTVMINGEKAAVVFDDCGFRHFVGPLPSGLTIISVTAQDEGGGVNTAQVAVYLE